MEPALGPPGAPIRGGEAGPAADPAELVEEAAVVVTEPAGDAARHTRAAVWAELG